MANIRSLINKLNYYTDLYDKGISPISDEQWDNLYFQLKQLEDETGIIYPDSPTQKIHYEAVSKLNKIEHNHPMLSLDKTKDIDDIKSFLGNKNWVAMAKMDGLTCSLRYLNGQLVSAETRGNGIEGEDILHNAKVVSNIPQQINYKDELIVDGEIICTYKNFEKFDKEYKNPRNFASGSIRLLDSKECARRNLTFIAWDVIKGFNCEFLTDNLICLRQEGFETVLATFENDITPTVEHCIEFIKEQCKISSYPIDGIVFKYNNINEYNAAGRTDHHFKGGLAYKFYDETYSTNLKYIEWTMGRTGVLTPVAVFDPIDIDGSTVERASLHNVSVMQEVLGNCAYVGEPLQVAKMNMIIPQIIEAGPKYSYDYIIKNGGAIANDHIEHCPICEGSVEYVTSLEGVVNAYCSNPNCEGKLINRLDHFCGKKGLDIKGLSKATFEKLINWGWLDSLIGLFSLNNFKDEWIQKAGFGEKSVEKILQSIEDGRHTTFAAFLSAIGIPLIGQVNAKQLADEFKTYEDFKNAVYDSDYNFYMLDGFGEEMNNSLKSFNYDEADEIAKLLCFEESTAAVVNETSELKGKIIVITGKLNNFKNRDELKAIIEQYGGKVTTSISQKTNILINNDINSTSSKNTAAKKYNIPIMSEQMFIDTYIENK